MRNKHPSLMGFAEFARWYNDEFANHRDADNPELIRNLFSCFQLDASLFTRVESLAYCTSADRDPASYFGAFYFMIQTPLDKSLHENGPPSYHRLRSCEGLYEAAARITFPYLLQNRIDIEKICIQLLGFLPMAGYCAKLEEYETLLRAFIRVESVRKLYGLGIGINHMQDIIKVNKAKECKNSIFSNEDIENIMSEEVRPEIDQLISSLRESFQFVI